MHPNPRCVYCKEIFLSVNDLDRHQQYICEKITIDCPLKQFGCEDMVHIHIYFFRLLNKKFYLDIAYQFI